MTAGKTCRRDNESHQFRGSGSHLQSSYHLEGYSKRNWRHPTCWQVSEMISLRAMKFAAAEAEVDYPDLDRVACSKLIVPGSQTWFEQDRTCVLPRR